MGTSTAQTDGSYQFTWTNVAAGGYLLTAVANDQFGQPLVDQPNFYFSSNGGTITNQGLFTATTTGGSYQVTTFSAVNAPDIVGSTRITVVAASNQPPTVATPAQASVTSNPAVFNLSVLGSDPSGEDNLIYTWGTIDSPSYSAPVTFGAANGTNAGKNTTATFSAPGGWGEAVHLVVTIFNPATGLSVTSPVSVTVSPKFSLVVTPDSATVGNGATQQFSAVAVDQFGNVSLPTVSWSIDPGGAGTIDDNGLYMAPATGTGSATVRATFVSVANVVNLSGTASVTLTNQSPASFAVTTTAADPNVAGIPFDVTVTVLDANGNIDTNYTGTIHFTSADPYGATLPADYTFTGDDAGTHTFAGGAALHTSGTWDVTATDAANGITGSANVNVVAAPATAFQALAPSNANAGAPFDVTLVAVDPFGNTDTNYTGTVTWTTTDSASGVVLPADYTFQPSDAGMVTFAGGVTLLTPGDQVLTATDTSSGITGNAAITVTGELWRCGSNGGYSLRRRID